MNNLKGNKGEWNEIYVFLKALSEGIIYGADESLNLNENIFFNILKIIRLEKNIGLHEYERQIDTILIKDLENELQFEIALNDFTVFSDFLFTKIKTIEGKKKNYIPEVEQFLKSINISKLTADSNTKSDITIQVHDSFTGSDPKLDFSIKSQLGSPATLLNASKSTNFKYRLSKELTINEISTINSLSGGPHEKINMLKSFKSDLIFDSCVSSTFKFNLQMIDYSMPEIVSLLLLKANSEKKFNINDLFNSLQPSLASNDSILYKHKFKQLLMNASLGMMPGTEWNGDDEATGGYIVVKYDGSLACFHLYNRNALKNYLFMNTKLENGSQKRHDFGKIYLEDGKQYFNLNLQVRFIK